jgi:sarcosine oxidase subunit beta
MGLMMMRKTADVVVIGGGSIGCSTAYNLARLGFKNVVVLEKRYICSGSTGRCGAGIRQQWGTEMNCMISRYSIKRFEVMNEELEYDDVEFRQNGYLMVTYSESEAAMLEENLVLHRKLGIPVQFLSLREIKEIVPQLNTERVVASTICMEDGQANPFKVTDAYARAARRRGVEIVTQTEVVGFKLSGNKISAVLTDRGEIATDTVVNATGPYAKFISAMLEHDLPVEPERHQIVVTEPLEPFLGPMVMNFFHKSYFQQVVNGSLLLGYGDPVEPKGINYSCSWQYLKTLAQMIIEQLPVMKKVNIIRHWAGHYGISPDGQPILGPVPGVDGYYLALGCGKGFMLSPMIGELIAQSVAGVELTMPIDILSVERFEKGELIIEPAVV